MAEKRLPSRLDTEAYVSDGGYICLKQDFEDGEQSIVSLPHEDIPVIIGWLQELVPEARSVEAENRAELAERRAKT